VTEKPERWVLDTSALLTLIEDEDGAARVEDLLRVSVHVGQTVELPGWPG
jgi:PIN domain nuclease of toxin-antitoxin system